MSPAHGELPYVDKQAITIAAPRERVWSALRHYAATSLRIRKATPSPDCSAPSHALASKSWTARRPIA
jgi:hypothetical protein